MNLKSHLLSWSYLNWHYRVKIWVREGQEKIDLLGMFNNETYFFLLQLPVLVTEVSFFMTLEIQGQLGK